MHGNGSRCNASLRPAQGPTGYYWAMDNLSLADLTVFARAAALGTLSLVARERGVPVSQISRVVARVEIACGAQLFRRSARGITLTQDGEAFLAFCQKVLETRGDLEADLSRSRRQVSGCVRVSLSSAIAQHWVAPSLPDLVNRHPQLGLDLLVEDGLVDLARSGVDIAIRTGNPTALSLVARKLGEIETGLYASAAYLQVRDTPCYAEDLMAHTLLANCEHPVLNRLRFSGGKHLMANSRMRASSTATLAQMTAEGLGIAHLPVKMAQALGGSTLRRLLTQEFQPTPVPVWALMLPERQRLPRIRACLEHLAQLFK
jgi:DNA-binding transcriptional LysR family regulator